jgi:non-heme chloroperoxidase
VTELDATARDQDAQITRKSRELPGGLFPAPLFGSDTSIEPAPFDQFKYGWANTLDEKEAKELYDTFHVAGSGISLTQMGYANLNPWTEAKVNTKNPYRGLLLIIDGEMDHTVPWTIANATYKRQRRNPGVTEIVKIPNRSHSLTIDHGWHDVAQTALDFVNRFVRAKPS